MSRRYNCLSQTQRRFCSLGACLVLLIFFGGGRAQGATITWANTAGGSWNTANNWSPNQVPGAADTALITASGTYVVTLNANTQVASLTVGGGSGTQSLDVANSTLSVSSGGTVNANGVLSLMNSTWGGALSVAGTLNWTNGATLNNGGAVTILSNAVLNITNGNANPTVYLNGALTNAGTVNWAGTGNIYVYNYPSSGETGSIVNLPGALFNVENDQTIYGEGAAFFDNAGTFTKIAGNNTTLYLAFTNTGVVDLASGTLTLNSGGVYQGATTGPGNVSVPSGTLVLAGTMPNLTIAGGTVTGVNASINNLTWSSGTLQGISTVTVAASWTGGSLGNQANLTVASNAVLNITNGNANPTVYLNGALTNAGTVNWAGTGNMYVYYYPSSGETGSIVNLPGALFNVENDQTIYGEGAAFFDNAGTFTKSAGNNTILNLTFTNTGVVDLASGTLSLNNGGRYAGTSTGPGSVNVPGGTLVVEGAVPSLVISGGTVMAINASVSNLVLSNGTLQGTCTVTALGAWTGGALGNGGSLTVASNAVLTLTTESGNPQVYLYGVLTNEGTVNWSGNEYFYVNNYSSSGQTGGIVNLPGAIFNIQNDQTIYGEGQAYFDNEGTFTKSAGNNTILNLTFTNSGVVDLASGTLSLNNGGRYAGTSTGPGSVNVPGGTLVVEGAVPSLVISGGTVMAINASVSNLVLSNGTLQGTCTVTALGAWTGGALGNGGSLTVASNAVLTLTTESGNPQVYLYGVLTNEGTVNWSGNEYFYVNNYSSSGQTGGIVNLSGAIFNIQNDQIIYNEGAAYINNAGTFVKSAGTNTTIGPTFNNTGVLATTIYSSGSFGQINLPNNVALSGSLNISFAPSYSPSTGDSFPLLTYPSATRAFSSVQTPPPAPWETNSITYGATAFTFSVGSIYKLAFAPGLAATNVAGDVFAPVVVQAQYLDGTPFATNGAPITMALAAGGGSLRGTTPQYTDVTGKATFSDLNIHLVGLKTLEASSFPWVTPASNSTTIIPAAAAQLALTTPIAYLQKQGYPFSPAPTVQVLDRFGNVVVNSTAAIAAQSTSSGSGTLRGAVLAAANGTNGTAAFRDLYFSLGNPALAESATVYFTSPGLVSVTNNPIMVEFISGLLTLTNGNSLVHIDPNSQNGMSHWIVDGIDQLSQHWFWLRQDPALTQVSFDQLGTPLGLFWNSSNALFQYLPAGLDASLAYSLQGGAPGSHASQVVETLSIQNTSNAAVGLHIYAYTDFDLDGQAAGESISFPQANTALQQGNGMTAIQTIGGPTPSFWGASWYALVLDTLETGAPAVLADNIVPDQPGNQTFAYQWDFNLGAGQTFVLNLTNAIQSDQVLLSIALSGTNVILSWPSNNAAGYNLQMGALNRGGAWAPVPTAPTAVGNNYEVTVPITARSEFYRLQK